MDVLIGNERRVIEDELRVEYEEKLETLLMENISSEYEKIDEEYVLIENKKAELDIREADILDKEMEINTLYEETEILNLTTKKSSRRITRQSK